MTVLTVAVLSLYDVPASDMALFGAYVALGLALPGLLLIRALHRRTRTLAEEIALGLALGYAVEVLVYIAARAVGLPLLVLAWPVTTYAVFLAVPRLRRHWRGEPRPRAPIWWSWSIALAIAYLVAWSARTVFRVTPLTWPGLGTSFRDMPFHLALIGELRHHMPPTMPMVDGEPLFYHWFVYAHMAAASWVTGVEPLMLLLRLSMLPMLAAFVVILGAIARRVIGFRAGALPAIAGALLAAAPSLYLGTNGVFTWGGIPDLAWTSPTQTFGTLLFAPVMLLLVELLERRRREAGPWLLLGVFLVAVMGAKATYLPLLGAGLLAVAAVEAVGRRRPPWPALAALGMTAACFLYAQTVLFGRASHATVVDPLSFMRTAWGEWTGLGDQAVPSPASTLGITLVFLLCWLVTWSGILGLLSRPRLLVRPGVVLMLGIGAAGLGTMFLLGHPTRSQLFFLWGAYPYLAIVSVQGLVAVLRRARVSLRAAAFAAGAGIAAFYLVAFICGVTIPLGPGEDDAVLYRPYIVLSAVAASAALVLTLTRGRLRAWALMTAACAAIGLPADLHGRVLAIGHDVAENASVETAPAIPSGTLAAARWLRDHSDPDDLVATNAHCLWEREIPCDSRHFWLTALSERHALVEGWAYASKNLEHWRPGQEAFTLPFWDPERIRLNDEAFASPSAAVMRQLRERYGVRWLFVDERHAGTGSGIGRFAALRFRSGDYAVYRMAEGTSL
ncbi:hypothetical protein [Streptosporangium subroseum]|uniref:hypothetical protein n=1 Tax=Streptosporangium subroseum TaxID=106412 RepID=UPI003091AF29|nr:hypothetical protein OHB15_13475 [Streptosporangium subroseum]